MRQQSDIDAGGGAEPSFQQTLALSDAYLAGLPWE